MKLHVSFPPPGCAEAQLAVRALERLRSGVQAHVHLQASFCRKSIAADMTAEQLLTCGKSGQESAGLRPSTLPDALGHSGG